MHAGAYDVRGEEEHHFVSQISLALTDLAQNSCDGVVCHKIPNACVLFIHFFIVPLRLLTMTVHHCTLLIRIGALIL